MSQTVCQRSFKFTTAAISCSWPIPPPSLHHLSTWTIRCPSQRQFFSSCILVSVTSTYNNSFPCWPLFTPWWFCYDACHPPSANLMLPMHSSTVLPCTILPPFDLLLVQWPIVTTYLPSCLRNGDDAFNFGNQVCLWAVSLQVMCRVTKSTDLWRSINSSQHGAVRCYLSCRPWPFQFHILLIADGTHVVGPPEAVISVYLLPQLHLVKMFFCNVYSD